MRTFIAVDLSDQQKQELAELQSELKKTEADVKWVEPENIHLTLKFLGEISDEQVGLIGQTLDKIADGLKPFEVSLGGMGAFPKLEYPRVIWVGIDKGKKETEETARMIEDELEKLGFKKEDREFSAHLTIGRVRSGKNKESLKNKIIDYRLPITDYQTVSSIILYQSKLSPKGPTYTPLHRSGFQK